MKVDSAAISVPSIPLFSDSSPLVTPEMGNFRSVRLAPKVFPADTAICDQRVNLAEVNKAVEKLNKMGEIFNRQFHFRIHEATHRIMVKVVNGDTGETINEIPPEKVLDMIASLQEAVGIIVDKKI